MQQWRRFAAIVFACGILLSITQTGWSQTRPVDVVLVLDQSGSMKKNDPQRLMGQAVGRLIEDLKQEDGVGLVLFGTRAEVSQPLGLLADGQREALLEKISRIRYADAQTNISLGIERGLYELKSKGRSGSAQALIFLTDGIMDTGSPAKDEEMKHWLREQLLPEAHQRGVQVFSIAFTEQADFMLIQEMAAATGGEYYRVLNASELPKTFVQLTTELRKPPKTTETVQNNTPSKPELGRQPATKPQPERGFGNWLGGAVVLIILFFALVVLAWRFGRPVPDKAAAQAGEGQTVATEVVNVPLAKLVDLQNSNHIRLSKPIFRIGREPDNDVVIPTSTVSAYHAQIEFREEQFFLRDLRSTNGTYLNKKRIDGEALLKSGDTLRFDEFRFTFMGPDVVGGAAPEEGRPELMRTLVREVLPAQPSDQGKARKTQSLELDLVEAMKGQAVASAKCPNHKRIDATVRCGRCQKLWCSACVQAVRGVTLCEECRKGQR